jgi:hypothetical protein
MKGIINFTRASKAQATGQRSRNDASFGNSLQSPDMLNQVIMMHNSNFALVVGGFRNVVGSWFCTIGSKTNNHPSGGYASVGGGEANQATNENANILEYEKSSIFNRRHKTNSQLLNLALCFSLDSLPAKPRVGQRALCDTKA